MDSMTTRVVVLNIRHLVIFQGAILCENGACDAALTCLEEALVIRKSCLGDIHELCADTEQWIGNVMREWERYDDALGYFKTALKVKKITLGSDHEGTNQVLKDYFTINSQS